MRTRLTAWVSVLVVSAVPLLAHHFAYGRYVWSAFVIDNRYDVLLPAYFSTTPLWGWVQVTAMARGEAHRTVEALHPLDQCARAGLVRAIGEIDRAAVRAEQRISFVE